MAGEKLDVPLTARLTAAQPAAAQREAAQPTAAQPKAARQMGAAAPWLARLAARGRLQVLGVYLALAMSWAALAAASPYFFTLNNIRNLFVASSTVALIAAGLTFVMIAGEIDLSFAAMQAFAGAGTVGGLGNSQTVCIIGAANFAMQSCA